MAVGYKNGKRVLVETVETTKPVYNSATLRHLRQCAKWHKYIKYRKNSIYGTFGTEMPHGTLAQVAQTSYMKGEFLYQLFIIMSINLHGGGDSLLSRLEIFRSE